MQLDLNLLTALDVLLEEESVQGAADRLHLSSPAMSRTLSRIRATTRDEILVRTGRTMTPTPYAVAVRDQVHQLVQQAQVVLRPQQELNLATLDRTFTLQCNDALTSAIASILVEAVRAEAPMVTLRFLAETLTDDHLRQGTVDSTLGSTRPAQPDARYEALGEGRLVVVLRRGHPLLAAPLDLASYAAAEHVLVSRRGHLVDPVDTLLAERGLHRRVAASVPTIAAALSIVGATDTITAIPELICRPLTLALDLHTVALPLPLPPVPVIHTWHRRHDNDPAHAWLREHIRQAVTQLH